MNILIVDDSPEYLSLLTIFTHKAARDATDSYMIFCASDGEEALTTFKKSPCNLLITDWRMPKVCGDELANSVLAIDPRVIVILCTSTPEAVKTKLPEHVYVINKYEIDVLRAAIGVGAYEAHRRYLERREKRC